MTQAGQPATGQPTAGLLVVDKPAGWTSHDVVARGRRLARTRRVGHAGTLDPMATGVLVLGVNQGTKLLTFLVGSDKTYTATVRLGQTTITDDAEGEVTATHDASGVTDEAIDAAVRDLTGDIQQVPSAVSAIKIKGVRSYARVRSGEQVELPARPVTVHRFDVGDRRRTSVAGQAVVDLDVEVEVSSGTYVRALARDLGAALGVGGHLTALRRTRVGGFGLDRAVPLTELEALVEADEPLPLVPLAEAAAAHLPVREVDADEADHLRHGRRLRSRTDGAARVAAVGPGGDLVAVIDESGPTVRTHVVLPAALPAS